MSKKVGMALCALTLVAGCRRPPAAPAQTARVISEVQMGDQSHAARLLAGFYESNGYWRWTAPVFRVALDSPELGELPITLELELTVPNELVAEYPSVTLMARVNGMEVGRQTYEKAGRHLFTSHVAQPALKTKPAIVEFEVDRAMKEPQTGRVQGVIAVSVALKGYEATEEYRQLQVHRAREGYQRVLEARKKMLPPAKQGELIRLFHELPVWENVWFHGVRIFKSPLDLWMVQQTFYEVQPDYVVETGTLYGASALYYVQALHGLGLTASRVLTVDIADNTQAASQHPLWGWIQFFHGSSTDPRIVQEIARLTRGAKTVVTLDSDHSMKHVLAELRLYAPMVSPGSYIIVEDTHMDGAGTRGYGSSDTPGPLAAVEQFLREDLGKQFERDPTREMFIMTWNPGGWLKRKAPDAGPASK
jgi:cephalosporin hydroxylase